MLIIAQLKIYDMDGNLVSSEELAVVAKEDLLTKAAQSIERLTAERDDLKRLLHERDCKMQDLSNRILILTNQIKQNENDQ